ncbi:MAG: amidohydrolase [Candidatus Cloacimonas sp.]
MLDLIELRHNLHKIPELAFKEFKTRALLEESISKILQDQPKDTWKLHHFNGNTGLLLEYTCAAGPYLLFRADMDALPIYENTGVDYASEHPGFMHSCGHDIHLAILMGLIQFVAINKPQRNLLFLFQPAEEGEGGAQSVLAEGIIQKFNIEMVLALHIASDLPVGAISAKEGIFFAIPQEFDVCFYGKSAHIAFPEKGIDALNAGIMFMNLITDRLQELKAKEKIIFHIGKMSSGTIRNVISDQCVLEGTHRSLSKEISQKINNVIKDTAAFVAKATGANYEVKFLATYDPVINNANLVKRLQEICQRENIQYIPAETAMTGEDFGFFTTLYPGLLFWLGSGCPQPLHSDKFLPKDESIEVGVKVFSAFLPK